MKSTARAAANIAFVKYWGNRDEALRLPRNGSISLTLRHCATLTTVAPDANLPADGLVLNGERAAGPAAQRVGLVLDHVRALAGRREHARVVSVNHFPTGCGIASSASGFAALAAAAAAAYDLAADAPLLSRLARRGSGSACRSVRGGFAEWLPGDDDSSSYAVQLADENHWPQLRDVVVVVSDAPKAVSSSDGHRHAATSPLYAARLAALPATLERVRGAVAARDLAALGGAIETEALSLHAVIMTAAPSVLYWAPGTVEVMLLVRQWRREGIEAYFTLDAGPNVHIITTDAAVPPLVARLAEHGYAGVITDEPGPGVRLEEQHLC